MRYRGSGGGNAVGAPLEAVVQDLCDTRNDLKKTTAAVKEMKATGDASKAVMDLMLASLVEIKGLMEELRDNTAAGITEAQEFRSGMGLARTKMGELKDAVEADTAARGAARIP
jgi:hypothetical protein